MKLAISALLLLVAAFPGSLLAQSPTEPLKPRSYAVVPLDDLTLAAGTTYGIVLYDVPTEIPENHVLTPRAEGNIPLPDSVNHLAVHNGILWAALGPHGVRGYRWQEGKLNPLASIETGGASMRLLADGDLLWIGTGTMGVESWNIKDPAHPKHELTLDTAGYARTIFLRGGPEDKHRRLWVADGRGGLVRYSVSGHRARSLGRSSLPGDVRWVGPFGKEMLVSLGEGGLCHMVPNASGGRAPKAGFCIENEDVVRDVATLNHWVFAADSSDGVMVIDWTNATQPNLMDRIDVEFSANALVIHNDRLYVAADAGGIRVFSLQSWLGNRQ